MSRDSYDRSFTPNNSVCTCKKNSQYEKIVIQQVLRNPLYAQLYTKQQIF